MSKEKRRIEVVPIWRQPVDQRLLVMALVAFADQLAQEAQEATSDIGPSGEVAHG
jgi:hypothetical protein